MSSSPSSNSHVGVFDLCTTLQAFLFPSIRLVGLFKGETWHCLRMAICLFYKAGKGRSFAGWPLKQLFGLIAAQRSFRFSICLLSFLWFLLLLSLSQCLTYSFFISVCLALMSLVVRYRLVVFVSAVSPYYTACNRTI